MKSKKKLISLICAFCLVLCLGVFGVLAITELNLNIGGEIKFSATGVKAQISDGRFVTGTDKTALVDYAGVWQVPSDASSKLKGFDVTTQKASYTTELEKWSGLKLKFNEAGDSVYLYFTIKNTSTDNSSLFVTISDNTKTLAEEKNINTSIVLPSIDPIASGATADIFIEFKLESKFIDALLKDFAIELDLKLKPDAIVDENGVITNMQGSQYTGVKYTLEDGKVKIDGTSASGDVVIVDKVVIGGVPYPVTEISTYAFYEAFEVDSVVIPNSVTKICSRAFRFAGLYSITIPDSVTIIEEAALSYNPFTSVEIPASVSAIEPNTFEGCNLNQVILNDGLLEIKSGAFADSGLKNIDIPSTVTTIGDDAFKNTELTSLILPKNLETVGCRIVDAGTDISIQEGNEKFHVVDNCLIEKATKTLRFSSDGIIPSDGSVEIIGSKVFYEFSPKTVDGVVIIPEGIKEIEESAFVYSVDNIELPSTIQKIGNLGICSMSLTVKIKATTPPEIFGIIPDMENINLIVPQGTTVAYKAKISEDYFNFGVSVDRYNIIEFLPDGSYVPEKIVVNSEGVVQSPSIEKFSSVTYTLSSYGTASAKLDYSVEEIYIAGEVVDESGKVYAVSEIEYQDLTGKELAVKKVEIAEGMNNIMGCAFWGCTELESVIIPESVTILWEGAFYGCTSLQSVIIPKYVTEIHMDVFEGCSNLTLYFKSETPPTQICLDDTYRSIEFTTKIYVPSEQAKVEYEKVMVGYTIEVDTSLAS